MVDFEGKITTNDLFNKLVDNYKLGKKDTFKSTTTANMGYLYRDINYEWSLDFPFNIGDRIFLTGNEALRIIGNILSSLSLEISDDYRELLNIVVYIFDDLNSIYTETDIKTNIQFIPKPQKADNLGKRDIRLDINYSWKDFSDSFSAIPHKKEGSGKMNCKCQIDEEFKIIEKWKCQVSRYPVYF